MGISLIYIPFAIPCYVHEARLRLSNAHFLFFHFSLIWIIFFHIQHGVFDGAKVANVLDPISVG